MKRIGKKAVTRAFREVKLSFQIFTKEEDKQIITTIKGLMN